MPELAPIAIETSPSNDLRSYHVSSAKIKRELGWEPKRTIEDAVVRSVRGVQDRPHPGPAERRSATINVKTVQASGLA